MAPMPLSATRPFMPTAQSNFTSEPLHSFSTVSKANVVLRYRCGRALNRYATKYFTLSFTLALSGSGCTILTTKGSEYETSSDNDIGHGISDNEHFSPKH